MNPGVLLLHVQNVLVFTKPNVRSYNTAVGKNSQNKQLRSVLTRGSDGRLGRDARQRVPYKTQPVFREFSVEV